MPNEYYLNGQALSAFGFVPGHASGSNLALSGAWDLPRRTGECYHVWPEENGIEPCVDPEEMRFGPRDIRLTGSLFGEDRHLFRRRLAAFRAFILSLPPTFELRCDWGRWQVTRAGKATVEVKASRVARITLPLREPSPDLSGAVPLQWLLATRFWNPRGTWMDDAQWYEPLERGVWLLETGLWNAAGAWDPDGAWYGTPRADLDDWQWASLGFIPSALADAASIPDRREIQTIRSASGTLCVPGGREPRSLTLSGWVVAADMEEFDRRARALVGLFGSAGLRRLRYQGCSYDCFATEGFALTDIQKREKVYAKFKIKLLERGNE